MTVRHADRAKKCSKRAVLFALIVASASTASAQQSSAIQHSPFFSEEQPRSVSPYVHQRPPLATPVSGQVHGNPFITAANTSVSNQPTPYQPAQGGPTSVGPRASASDVGLTEKAATPLNRRRPAVRKPVAIAPPAEAGRNSAKRGLSGAGEGVDLAPVPSGQIASPKHDESVSQEPPFAALIAGAKADPIDAISNRESIVVPAADAQDAEAEVRAKQPVFLSLSDDNAALKSPEPKNQPAKKKLGWMTIQSAPVNPVNAAKSESRPESATVTEPAIEPADAVRPEAVSETPAVSPKPTTESDSEWADLIPQAPEGVEETLARSEQAIEPVDVPTLVKLAPVIRLAQELPQPIVQDEPSVVEESSAASELDQEMPTLVKRKGNFVVSTPAVSVATPQTQPLPVIDNPIAAQKDSVSVAAEQAEVKSLDVPAPKRKLIAVVPPPLRVERTRSGKDPMQPTARVATMDPSRMVASAPAVEKAVAPTTEVTSVAKATVPVAPSGVTSEVIPQLPAPTIPSDVGPVSMKLAASSDTGKSVLSSLPAQTASVATKGQREQTASFKTERGGSATPEAKKAVVLNLSRAQVRSLTIGGALKQIHVVDNSVCQAFQSGSNQIKLIGTGIGATELTVSAEVKPGEPTRTQTFRIEVSETVDATGGRIASNIELLNESISHVFPRASVVVSQRGGRLLVTGRCDAEQEAKQIVRMVRKSCLVPVTDNLKVR